ncbi:MAG TPA: TIGR04222 domain-containing membrane protein [Vicinamibacterales bacterium]|nr:TIGR04222 domain-containing membrane protein [Vicinamibacterales bacterium]
MNPLDLTGPEFLRLYALLAIAAVVAGVLLERLAEGAVGEAPVVSLPLAALDAAYLRGGFNAVAEATLATLIHRGAITVDDASDQLRVESRASAVPTGHQLEREVLDSFGRGGSLPAAAICDRAAGLAESLAEPLERHGLAFSPGQRRSLGLALCLPLIAVLALGVTKILVGLSRGRPVSILTFLCFATAAGAVAMFLARPIATPAGRAALRRVRDENEALRETSSRRTATLSPDDVAMAVGLFGLGAVADPSLLALRRQLHPPPSTDGGTSGCGSGSSCGSGCGGGGGCGGCGG